MTFSRANTRVVKRVLADGSVKTYRYGPRKKKGLKPDGPRANAVEALLRSYRLSPEWLALADSTRANYNHYLKIWDDQGGSDLSVITRKTITQFRNSLAKTSGNGAANVFARVTSALLGWAVENGWMTSSPAVRMKKLDGGDLPPWTEEQVKTALQKLPEPLRRVVILGMHTGQRRGDLIKMRWTDIAGDKIRVTQQKTGAALLLPINLELASELAAWKGKDVFGFILKTHFDNQWVPTYLSRAMGKALQEAGLPKRLNVHGLRKLAATRLANSGCSTHEIAAITGHKTLAMVQAYTLSANQEKLAEAAVFKLAQNADKTDKLTSAKSLKS